jgi:predicted RNA-binding protein
MKKTMIILLLVAVAICAAVLIFFYVRSGKAKPLPAANIYMAGVYGTGELENDTAYFMINDSLISLLPASSRVSGIYYFNGDVYVSGIYNKDGNTTPCYWKNSELITLPVEKYSAYTSGIFVNDRGVFVSGHINDTDKDITPCYWQNDSLIVIPINEEESCFTRSIYADDNDVYVAGYSNYTKESLFFINACCWMNGKKILLDTMSSSLSIATHVIKEDTNLYIAGRIIIEDTASVCIWKNGVRTDLYSSYNEMPGERMQIFNFFEASDFLMIDFQKGSLVIPATKILAFTVSGGNTYTIASVNDSIICLINNEPSYPVKDTVNAEIKAISVCKGDTLIAGMGEDSLYMWRNNIRKGIVDTTILKDRVKYFYFGRD